MKQSRPWFVLYYLLLLALVCGAVLSAPASAKYIKRTEALTNVFAPGEPVPPTIEEEFENNVKENVSVNVGETGYPVYVRVKVVITWKNEDGMVCYQLPEENKDYTIDYNLLGDNPASDGIGWVYDENDGFYYYTGLVQSKGSTGVLITVCQLENDATPPEGYFLSVDIIAQTIQASAGADDKGDTDYKRAWETAMKDPEPTPGEEPGGGEGNG